MKIQCDCGKFQAVVVNNGKKTPGRLVCYCDDCQAFAKKLGREDVLDDHGGTEVIPFYPGDIAITAGKEQLCFTRLTPRGPRRLSTLCCNSPILNTRAKFPWAGVFNTALLAANPDAMNQLGPVKARIMGAYATSSPPFPVSPKIARKDMLVVIPFILKGKLFGKYKNSPFFESDGVTPVPVARPD